MCIHMCSAVSGNQFVFRLIGMHYHFAIAIRGGGAVVLSRFCRLMAGKPMSRYCHRPVCRLSVVVCRLSRSWIVARRREIGS